MSALRLFRFVNLGVAVLSLGLAVLPRPSFAQAIAAIVNGDPITTLEVDEQMKFRQIVKEPATRADALEDIIGDRIKLRAANRNGIDASDASFSQALGLIASRAKMSSSAVLAEFQRAKLNIDLVRSHLRSVAAWNDFVKSRYKALNVSQSEVDAAMAKDASLSRADTDYTLQQIVFVLPVNPSAADIEQRTREAQALRARFQDCASGVPLARGLPNVAIKPQVNKTATSMNDATRKALEDVQKGHLTTPTRTASGIELVAVCNKADDVDNSSVRDTVASTLLVNRLQKESDRMYKELRDRAVVEKR